MDPSFLLVVSVCVMILMFVSLYAVIVSFKEDIRVKSRVEGQEINKTLGLNPMSSQCLSAKQKEKLLERWYNRGY